MAVGAPPAPPAARQRKPKAPTGNAAYLKQYYRANGNMSVERRFAVIAPALERAGYTPQQAEDISIDAPLSKDYTNERAYFEALKYASSIAPGGTQTVAGAALAPALVPMPAKAQQQYQQLQTNNKPMGQLRNSTGGFFGSVVKGLQSIGEKLQPTAQKIGDQATPGGIGTLFAINLLFLAAVVPANPQGYTRLELAWLTLLDRTKLTSEIPPAPVPNNALVEAVIGGAEGIQEAAQAIGNVAGAIGGVTGGVAGFFDNIPVIGPIIQGLGIGGGPAGPELPPTSTNGSQPPMINARAPSQPPRVGR